MKRVIGIGNALTDMLVNLESDSVLRKYSLEKGSMSLVDSKLQTEISKSVAGLPYSLSLGGSAGNTIRAMARLAADGIHRQGRSRYDGRLLRAGAREPRCEALHLPRQRAVGQVRGADLADGERTMITHLGAALELTAADVPRRHLRRIRLRLHRGVPGAEPRTDRAHGPDGQRTRIAGGDRPGEFQHRQGKPRFPARPGRKIRGHRLRQRGRSDRLHGRERTDQRLAGHFAALRTWRSSRSASAAR